MVTMTPQNFQLSLIALIDLVVIFLGLAGYWNWLPWLFAIE